MRLPAEFAVGGSPPPPTAAFPVFIKPDAGEGSKGAHLAANANALAALVTPAHLVLEYLPGDEFTVDCVSDSHCALCFASPRRRIAVRAGISVLTAPVSDALGEFAEFAARIARVLRLVGAWFFQVKRAATGELCLLEVAPRVSGAMAAHRALGVNFPLLALLVAAGSPISVINQLAPLAGTVCAKVYENRYAAPTVTDLKALYVDLDDTLLLPTEAGAVRGPPSVNTDVLSVVYDARRAGVPVCLITRHKSDVSHTLASACVPAALFVRIVHLRDASTPKAAHILERPAALLDDSFRDRADASASGVLVFDIDAVPLIRAVLRALRLNSRKAGRKEPQLQAAPEFEVRDVLADPRTAGVTPSLIDSTHFLHQRAFVAQFMAQSAAAFPAPRVGALLLDIAPQDHAGAAPFEEAGYTRHTADLDSSTGPTFVMDITHVTIVE